MFERIAELFGVQAFPWTFGFDIHLFGSYVEKDADRKVIGVMIHVSIHCASDRPVDHAQRRPAEIYGRSPVPFFVRDRAWRQHAGHV